MIEVILEVGGVERSICFICGLGKYFKGGDVWVGFELLVEIS